MADKKKTGKKGASSADDIIEALAQEMGVGDEDEDDDIGEDLAEEADASDDDDDDKTPIPVDLSPKKARKKAADRAPDPEPSSEPPDESAAADGHSNDETIHSLFGLGQETAPKAIDEDDIEEPMPTIGGPAYFGIALVLGIAALVAAYVLLPEERKECLQLELRGDSCAEYHQRLEAERQAEERRQQLANAPKYGALTITTDPRALRITAAGHASMVQPDESRPLLVPTRSRTQYVDISVTEPFSFTIHGDGNFVDRTVTLAPYGTDGSPWIQNQVTGEYSADLVYAACWPGAADFGADHCITPVAELARELRWRINWRPPLDPAEGEPTRLFGSITVTSDPPGAFIAYNDRQLFNEETGEPYVTPHTFNQFNQPIDREDRTPSDVFLSRDGTRIQVLIEGKLTTTDSVYSHFFLCNPVEGATPPPEDDENPNFMGYCTYTYEVHLELRDLPSDDESAPAGDESGEEDAETP